MLPNGGLREQQVFTFLYVRYGAYVSSCNGKRYDEPVSDLETIFGSIREQSAPAFGTFRPLQIYF
jgi:hypothetical protein